jgi:hypothetical protein
MNHKELTALIKKISGQANFIGTPRIYVDIFDGDLVIAVWFNQVVYWDGKNKEPIGFYKTYKEWHEELGLSEYQVRRSAKECERLGLVNIMFKKVYGTPKNHYLVIWDELLKVINQTLDKPDPEESEGSENEPSEGEENAGSKEGEGSKGSLSIDEITPKSHIDKNKDSFLEIISDLKYSLFSTDIQTWFNVRKILERPSVDITGEADRKPDLDEPMKIVISGLSEKPKGGQFTLAEIWEERFTRSFRNQGIAITFTE